MKDLGLYIHIPFCEKKCYYCAFVSKANASSVMTERYLEALLKEIAAWRGIDANIRTIYFGGGTPSFIPSWHIQNIMTAMSDIFHFDPHDPSIEKTIEVNPGSASFEKLSIYRRVGFNRLSVGLQAAQDHLLELTGRVHRLKDFTRTIEDAGNVGFTNVSADLLFGLPNQRVADLRESIDCLLSFKNIRHISCYSLSVEPDTDFYKLQQSGKLLLPSEDREREMYETIRSTLSQYGMIQYEISNFAFSGYESRHNSAYWNLTPYVGLGVAAASFYNKRRWINEMNIDAYCDAMMEKRSIHREEHILSEKEAKGDFMFLGLRRLTGVSDRDYRVKFGSSFFDDYKHEIKDLLHRKLIEKNENRIYLSRLGLDFANQVFMAFV